jgi:hypothetical protein
MKLLKLFALLIFYSFLFCTALAYGSDSLKITDNKNAQNNTVLLKSTSLDRAPANYLMALKQTNEGVVESAIIKVMKLKYYYPQMDYSEITAQLEKLEMDGNSESIRFMAYIVGNYIKHPERFAWVKKGVDKNTDKFFALINERVVSQVQQ